MRVLAHSLLERADVWLVNVQHCKRISWATFSGKGVARIIDYRHYSNDMARHIRSVVTFTVHQLVYA